MSAIAVTEKNLPSRNRLVKSQFRKQQLIETTIDCIDKLGISQTTLANIARMAGVSQGNIIFHFQSKELLLEQTLRHLSDEYMACWKESLAKAGDEPMSQLQALIRATFSATVCNRKKISVWYAFWGESRSRPKYMQLCGQRDLAFSETLTTICQQLEKTRYATLSAETAALSIEGMIDGLWQNFLIGPAGFKRAKAVQALLELVDVIYPKQIK